MNWWEIENKAIEQIRNNIQRVNKVHIAESTGDMLEANKEQIQDSKLYDGSDILPKYSPDYAEFKGFRSPNLYLTGDFTKKMYIDFNNDTLIINSTDWKTKMLKKRYSNKIFGLTKKNAEQIFNKDADAINKKNYDYISTVISKAL